MRASNISRRLAEAHEVHIICLAPSAPTDPSLEKVKDACASITIVPHDFSRSVCALKSLLTFTPYDIVIHQNGDFRAILQTKIRELRPDCVYFSRFGTAPYVQKETAAAQVIDQHDLSHAFWRTASKGAEKLWFRLFAHANYYFALRAEKALYPLFDAVVSVSAHEMEQTKRFLRPMTPIITIPNGADTAYYQPAANKEEAQTIVFIGAMNALRNIDAVSRFVEQIFPTILRHRPAAKLQIVGHSPSTSILKFRAARNIEVTGEVDDVRPFLAGATVVIAPFWSGSGVKHKVPIAMAMEKALVVTKNACQGLSISHEKEVLVAESNDEFAQNVLRLLDDSSLRQQLGTNARRLIVENYSWDSLVHNLSDWINGTVCHRSEL